MTALLGVDREFIAGLGRAFVGALLFSLPMLMTMEMWWLGFVLDPWRLLVFVVVSLPMLVGLSRVSGFEKTDGSITRGIADALVALAVAAVASFCALLIFNVITFDMPFTEILGKVVLQTIPASIGALLARSQLGENSVEEDEKGEPSYGGELFLMLVGALFLSLNVAPTEEMVLIAYMMLLWHELILLLASLAIMHAIAYSVQFRGGHAGIDRASFFSIFARFTVVGYALVLLVSLGVLWLFGHTDASTPEEITSAAIVLAFPGAIGAAAARLVL